MKIANKAFIENEDTFSRVVDQANDGIAVTDTQGTIIFVNSKIQDYSGYTRKELIDQPFYKLVIPEHKQSIIERFNRNFSNKNKDTKYEYTLLKKDQSKLEVEANVLNILFQDQPAALIIIKDITTHKQAEERNNLNTINLKILLDMQKLADSTYESIINYMVETSVKALQSQFSYIGLVSPDELEVTIHGWSEGAMTECNIKEQCLHFTVAQAGMWGEVIKQRRPILVNDYDTSAVLKKGYPDGHVPIKRFLSIPVFKDDKIVTIAAVANKATEYDEADVNLLTLLLYEMWNLIENKKSKEKLTESNEKLRILFESLVEGLVITDTNGIITAINTAAVQLYGYESKEELIGQNAFSFVAEQDIKRAKRQLEKSVQEGYHKSEEYSLLKKDGNEFLAEMTTSTIKNATGAPSGIVATFRDITERKQAEEELKQANNMLISMNEKIERHSKKVNSLGEMTEMLELCSSIQESPPVITKYMTLLFPDFHGTLFIFNNSRTEMQSIVSWGASHDDIGENIFPPDSCWGLRRGKYYLVINPEIEPVCPHLTNKPTTPYACLPLIAKGEILGLLHLRLKQSVSDREKVISDLQELETILVEYVSLSIANLKLRESLINQSIKDPLTGIFNRRYMEETLQREISRAERKRSELSIVMMDIDHFKKFNDIYGHEAGDEILVKLAEFFRLKIRQSDVFCRFGGEEFIMILPESNIEDTFNRFDQLREEVKSLTVHYQNQRLPAVALSMGIAAYPEHGADTNKLLLVADKALYKAKQEGRDKIIIGSV
jgi:diguanylate cyclase (GGDEF)-like protein/PAS domain S-box-containing protein